MYIHIYTMIIEFYIRNRRLRLIVKTIQLQKL